MSAGPNVYSSRSPALQLPPVCVAVAAANPAEMIEKLEAALTQDSFVEVRLDYQNDPRVALSKLQAFIKAHAPGPLIATCRRAANGGRFPNSPAAQAELLLKAASAGFQLIDLELETAEALEPALLQRLGSAAGLVLSYHDFRRTRNLEKTFARMKSIPADYYKLVSTANCLRDNLLMMRFLLEKSPAHPLIGFCMGAQGILSRVLARRFGSLFTYAAAVEGAETAPGQLTASALRELFRIHQIDAATRIYGVAGDPVAHSLSPAMMNVAFCRENVNAVYVPLLTHDLDDLLACVREIPLSGLSVTMPYKEAIVARLDARDALTQQTGACNTVVRAQDGRILGFNTDVAGVLEPVQQRLPLDNAKVLVIGAGGAARAAVFGMKNRGAEVFVTNRTPAKAKELAGRANAHYLRRSQVNGRQFDLIVNATAAGMKSGESPLDQWEIHARFAMDVVYSMPETTFTRAAKGAGAVIIPAVEMFVQQGARQFEIWTGKPAPIPEMLNVVSRGPVSGS